MKFNFNIPYKPNSKLKFTLDISRVIDTKKNPASVKKKINLNELGINKIFCIGFGKTATTSLEHTLKDFGLKLGNQAVGEMLVEDWYNKKYDRIIRFCYTADAFQDNPFGCPGLYKSLDKAFPNSKFILTVRDNSEEWYNSLVRFHTKLFSDTNEMPTESDLDKALYRYKGHLLDTRKWIYNYPEVPLYDPEYYQNLYLQHIEDVKKYFKNESEKLLILNVKQENSYQDLCNFLGIEKPESGGFPWLNKSK